jgi:probable HAF family extracellular repeat protein
MESTTQLTTARRRRTLLLAFVSALAVAVLSLGISVLFAGEAQASGPSYTVTNLGILDGDQDINARGLNDAGQVVGESGSYDNATDTQVGHAWLWDSTNRMQDLGTLGQESSGANGINESGHVVGASNLAGADRRHDTRPFLWDSASGMQNLGTPDGYDEASAYDINDAGQVVGNAWNWNYTEGYGYSTTERAFLWKGGDKINLGTLDGSPSSNAVAINTSGQVTGFAMSGDKPDYRPFLWQDGVMTELPTLPGTIGNPARDINDQGYVVGAAYYPRNANGDYPSKAWIYKNGNPTALPALPAYVLGTDYMEPTAINNAGQVVGYTQKANDYTDTSGWLYSGGQMYNLKDLVPSDSGWTMMFPRDINDKGQIVGMAKDSSDVWHAVLLTPNPQTSVDSASGTVADGGTVSTGGGTASSTDPINTSITTPVAGSVSIQETTVDQSLQPSGFTFFGQQVDIQAPQATIQNPLTLTFVVDSSLLPAGTDYTNLQLFRDGSRIANCGAGASATTAVPDPCIKQRSQLSDGDAQITVLSSHASSWNFGVANPGTPLYSFQGFLQPVDNPPTFNSVKAGATVPVVFSLGGNKGLDILNGVPTSEPMSYAQGAPVDAIEKTVPATSSGLYYNKKLNVYSYNWTTSKSWAGTYRKFTLKLKDGTEHVAYFKFTK